jgi:hypothetical protein
MIALIEMLESVLGQSPRAEVNRAKANTAPRGLQGYRIAHLFRLLFSLYRRPFAFS